MLTQGKVPQLRQGSAAPREGSLPEALRGTTVVHNQPLQAGAAEQSEKGWDEWGQSRLKSKHSKSCSAGSLDGRDMRACVSGAHVSTSECFKLSRDRRVRWCNTDGPSRTPSKLKPRNDTGRATEEPVSQHNLAAARPQTEFLQHCELADVLQGLWGEIHSI